MTQKQWKIVTIVLAAVFFVVAVFEFLLKRDTPDSLTGLEVLGNQKPSFWIGVVIWSVVGAAVGYFGIKALAKKQDLGGAGPLAIAIGIFILAAFGKACTDKASSSAKNTNIENRVPAQELVK